MPQRQCGADDPERAHRDEDGVVVFCRRLHCCYYGDLYPCGACGACGIDEIEDGNAARFDRRYLGGCEEDIVLYCRTTGTSKMLRFLNFFVCRCLLLASRLQYTHFEPQTLSAFP